jgi:hypothetical protein
MNVPKDTCKLVPNVTTTPARPSAAPPHCRARAGQQRAEHDDEQRVDERQNGGFARRDPSHAVVGAPHHAGGIEHADYGGLPPLFRAAGLRPFADGGRHDRASKDEADAHEQERARLVEADPPDREGKPHDQRCQDNQEDVTRAIHLRFLPSLLMLCIVLLLIVHLK